MTEVVTAARRTFRQRVRRQVKRLAVILAVFYVGIGLLLDVFQDKLIYPGAATQGTAEAQVDPPAGAELVALTAADGTKLVGLFARTVNSAGPGSVPTVIFFYGNGMCMRDAVENISDFRRHGTNVMLVDFPGYGMSQGKVSEAGCYAAGEAAYQYVLAREDLGERRVVAAGWSLGAAVAIDLAARHAGDGHIVGVIACSAFTSMTETAAHHYPMFPVGLLLRSKFESAAKIGKIRVPILLAHGKRDDIIPFAMRDRLAAAAGGPVTRVTLEDASHNDFFDADEEVLTAALGEFLGPFASTATLPAGGDGD